MVSTAIFRRGNLHLFAFDSDFSAAPLSDLDRCGLFNMYHTLQRFIVPIPFLTEPVYAIDATHQKLCLPVTKVVRLKMRTRPKIEASSKSLNTLRKLRRNYGPKILSQGKIVRSLRGALPCVDRKTIHGPRLDLEGTKVHHVFWSHDPHTPLSR
jgi:hypothetical protein